VDEPAEVLVEAVEQAVPGWVERSVESRVVAARGSLPEDVHAAASVAGAAAAADVAARLRDLLALDVEEQRANPLALLRTAVRYPTDVLRTAGIPPVARDEFSERSFPDDVYDLSPATWRDVDDSLFEPGIAWGAWKAHQVLRRHRSDGAEGTASS
jgi:hypothetical protein